MSVNQCELSYFTQRKDCFGELWVVENKDNNEQSIMCVSDYIYMVSDSKVAGK